MLVCWERRQPACTLAEQANLASNKDNQREFHALFALSRSCRLAACAPGYDILFIAVRRRENPKRYRVSPSLAFVVLWSIL